MNLSEERSLVAPGRLAVPRASKASARCQARGKFIFAGQQKVFVRGVTYGAFRPDEHNVEYHDLAKIERDFALMAANGINAVRIPHTMPPRALLDIAQRHGLRVMVGLSAEQYVGYLIDKKKKGPNVAELIRAKVRPVAGHPALLCCALGNEISAHNVRWIGRRRIEGYLKGLYHAVKEEDPEAIVTYVNYPTTEYLQLPFLDVVSFNVYLESQGDLDAYLARLQNLAGDRPLLMSELGIDSLRNGEDEQARVLEWQVRTSFAAGCAGAFIFSWTDEWFRGGGDVEDWAFGLTRVDRRPKPALAAVREAFGAIPLPAELRWPRISVVVCTYNGRRTISDCLDGLRRLDYPNYEVIVVNDGSRDLTEEVAAQAGFRLITTENRGLSHARNVGLQQATGEIIAYTDDDARPDPHWLTYLAAAFMRTAHGGIGGPNIAPPGDGEIADCVANAPGGPMHVLLSDTEAEHIPGCNMVFRKAALMNVGGFDPIFQVAGDDVDVCWRLQEQGYTLGFCAPAMVWHHRRNSIRTYWRQQAGYGKAEALLEAKWPEKYNAVGHVTWGGRVYGKGITHILGRASRVYHGTWGTAPFQSLHQQPPPGLLSLPAMPEWWLIVALLAGLNGLGVLWPPLLWLTLPLWIVSLLLPVAQAIVGAAKASFTCAPRTPLARFKLYAITAGLHLTQPIARLVGRLRHGLTAWRWRGPKDWQWPRAQMTAVFTRRWIEHERRLEFIEKAIETLGAVVQRGGGYDRWDCEVRGGLFGKVRLLMAIEDQGSGTQFVRVRSWPVLPGTACGIFAVFGTLAAAVAFERLWLVAAGLALPAMFLLFRSALECGRATATVRNAVQQSGNFDP